MSAQVKSIIYCSTHTSTMCNVWKISLILIVAAGIGGIVQLFQQETWQCDFLHNAFNNYISKVWVKGIKMSPHRRTTNACCWLVFTCWVRELMLRTYCLIFLLSQPPPPQPTPADKPLLSISEFLDEWENNRRDQSRWPCKLSLCYIYANEQCWWRSWCCYVKEKWTASKMIRLGNEPKPECLVGRCYSSDSLWQLQNWGWQRTVESAT